MRHLARRPVDRAAVIRRGIAELGDRYRAEVWAWWNNNAGIWEVNFQRLDGGPTVEEFKAAIAQHSSLRDHHQAIAVATEAGAALRWARQMRLPGAAVILDTVIRADGCLSPGRRLSANSFLRVLPKPG